jgi:hypothetical protein
MAELSTGSRLEANLAWYLQKQFTPKSSAPGFYCTNDGRAYEGPEYVCLLAMQDVSESPQMPNAERLAVALEIVTQVDEYPDAPQRHKALVEKLLRALVDVPASNVRTLRASKALLRAVNKYPGIADPRPEKDIHLWDFRDVAISVSSLPEGMCLKSIIAGTATCSPTYWPATTPYGDI